MVWNGTCASTWCGYRRGGRECRPGRGRRRAPRVRYGAERAERLTVAVTAPYGPVPATRVAIMSGRTVLCTPVLTSGKGSSILAARQLRLGTYTLTVAYPGNANFAGSASARKTLTITR